jgi:hypothetical protein
VRTRRTPRAVVHALATRADRPLRAAGGCAHGVGQRVRGVADSRRRVVRILLRAVRCAGCRTPRQRVSICLGIDMKQRPQRTASTAARRYVAAHCSTLQSGLQQESPCDKRTRVCAPGAVSSISTCTSVTVLPLFMSLEQCIICAEMSALGLFIGP